LWIAELPRQQLLRWWLEHCSCRRLQRSTTGRGRSTPAPFDAEFFKDFTTAPNGFVYKKVTNPDTEKPVPFQKVFVQYTGYLEDGTKFDSSYDRDGLFSFRLGKGKVIQGWEATVGGMAVGQKVIVKIPPKYAYGDKKTGPIPANSNLIFYIELVKLGGIKGDKPRLGSQQD